MSLYKESNEENLNSLCLGHLLEQWYKNLKLYFLFK